MKLHNIPLALRFSLSILFPLVLVIWFIQYSLSTMEDILNNNKQMGENHIAIEQFSETRYLLSQLILQQRRYLLTGNKNILQKYQAIDIELDSYLQKLMQLTSTDLRKNKDIENITLLINNWKKLSALEIEKRKRVASESLDLEDVALRVKKDHGQTITDDLRVALDTLHEQLKELGNKEGQYWLIALGKDIAEMESGLSGYLLTAEEDYLEPYNNAQISFRNNLLVLRNTLNDDYEDELYELDILLSSWVNKIAKEQIDFRDKIKAKEVSLDDVIALVKSDMNQDLLRSLEDKLLYSLLDLRNNEQTIIQSIVQRQEKIEKDVLWLSGLIVFFSLWLLSVTIQSVIKPIRKLVFVTGEVAKGNLSIRTKIISNDEIGQLSAQLDTMLNELEEKRTRVEIEEKEREQAVRQLEHIIEERDEYNWLKTQLANITGSSQGVKEVSVMVQRIITLLAKQVNAAQGVFYINHGLEKSADKFQLMGSYAFEKRKHMKNTISPGEGLVGQCILEKETIILTQVPADYVVISSGLGEHEPLVIIVLPVLFEEQVLGVIELSGFTAFTSLQQELLQEVASNLGVIVNSVLSHERTESLLTESQRLTLESQNKTEELQVQTEELQAQTDELQFQSKKLKSANKELQDKTTTLEQQKEEIESARQIIETKMKELEESSRYKSEFLANMSHELRTPLNSLLILSKILSDNEEGNLTVEQVHSASVIHEGGQELLNLINDILDLSKIEANKLSINRERVELHAVLRNIEHLCAPLAENKKLEFSCNIAANVPDCIETDGKRLEQILRNLLSNAVKFTNEGSITLIVERENQDDGICMVCFRVKDTGIGISEEKYQFIFEAFQQSDGSISRRFGGTGLGLTISRMLADLLGGKISLISKETEGSTFTLAIPCKEMSNERPKEEAVGDIVAKPVSKSTLQTTTQQRDKKLNRSLLIYEKDPELAGVFMEVSQAKGYQCLLVNNRNDVLNIARNFHPDAIILNHTEKQEIMELLGNDETVRNIPVHMIDDGISRDNLVNYLEKPVSTEAVMKVLSDIEDRLSEDIKHILVIEDDQQSQHATMKLIQSRGIEVSVASYAREAYEKIQHEEYDCLIVDLGLPDMSGDQLLEKLYKNKIAIPPVIIYTARDLDMDEYKHLQQYTNSIVIKGDNSCQRLRDEFSLFLFGLEKEENNEISESETLHTLQTRTFQGKTVLLVDDDIRNTFALSGVLARQGLEISVADNGQKALDKLEEEGSFDIVLMDIMMPIMDGYEAISRIRANKAWNGIPVIALTAKAMKGDEKKCIDAGANDYLTKPVDMDKLLSILNVWLGDR